MSTVRFNADLNAFAKKLDVSLDTVVRKVALDAYGRVTKKTPVDTGRARANWNVGAGRPDLRVDKSATRIKRPSLKRGDGKKVIFITNNLPYINALENGHSTQAPNGMVQGTLNELAAGIRDVMG